MASLGSAGNVHATCLRILRAKGYALSRHVSDYEDDDGGPHGYLAEKDGFTFAADDPIELLGLTAIYEHVRPSRDEPYWWVVDGPDIDDELMERALERAIAEDVHVRKATVSDAAAIARVHVESSEDAYAPLAKAWSGPSVAGRTEDWTDWLTRAQAIASRIDLVAELGTEVVGFITVGPPRPNDTGAEVEVYVLHVLPAHRGKGVGSRLWRQACEVVRGPRLRSMFVETYAELRCCSFYEARGGTVCERAPEDFMGGTVTRVVYLWAGGQPSG